MLTSIQRYEVFYMLFAYFGIAQGKDRIRYLLHCSTASAYHSLFRNLKYIQDDIEFMQKCCYVLIRKDDRLSYNMASILCKYFDIPNVRGVFSLNIEPFQLNYLDSSQQAFTKVLISVWYIRYIAAFLRLSEMATISYWIKRYLCNKIRC